MRRFLASAKVIARRDYIATAFSRSFMLFLFTPLMIVLFSGAYGYLKVRMDVAEPSPLLVVVARPADAAHFLQSYKDVSDHFSDGSLPALQLVSPKGNTDAQAQALLKESSRKVHAIVVGLPDMARLIGPRANVVHIRSAVKLALDHAQTNAVLTHAGLHVPALGVAETMIDPAGSNITGQREALASGAQTILFMLNMLLAGMLLSNLVEEKSNKIIEILVAAVPVDAVFFGKLLAMLCVSLTGIAVWAGLLGTGYMLFAPPELVIPTPAIGWGLFVMLGIIYFITSYLLLGSIFLGIGAQANSVREIQTLSMPVTFSQVVIFMVASLALGNPHGAIWTGAALFPLSSPLVMFAQGARDAALWPHALALAWQSFWVLVIVRLASHRFRMTVLKSGPSVRRRKK